MTPRVSVVMPAFNAVRTVGAAISGVLWQTYRDLELIVVDDGSTDGTIAVVGSFPGRVRVLRQEHGGVAAARNHGIRASDSELIAFCDADDIWLDDQLLAMVDLYDRRAGIVTTDSWWLLPGGVHPARRRYKGRFPAPDQQRIAILQQNFLSTMSLFPRSLHGEIGGFSEDLARAEDWDFWARAIFAGYRVALQRRPLSLYRWGGDSLSADPAEMDADIDSVLRRISDRDDLTRKEREYLEGRLAGPGPRALSRQADKDLRAGLYYRAARGYRRAALLCPVERPLVWKARLISIAPPILGPVIRRRQLAIEQATGFTERHVR